MSRQGNRRAVLARLADAAAAGRFRGMPSVCSAHPLVLEAALRRGRAEDVPVLIEATCNQVNQEGGYTGMTPLDFRAFVEAIAARVGFSLDRLILGGDHLGPNPWKALPAGEAMQRAEAMVAAYVAAGFRKIHLDCSMGCAGEPAALDDETTATRAARLAGVAERQAVGTSLVYIVGTEVPPPGGATHAIAELAVTSPVAVKRTLDVHRRAFAAAGVEAAFGRVIGIVVQPGVEFGNANVAIYRPGRARALSAALDAMPGLVYEAHSTDYQPATALRALVDDGFAILKVGPGLTFALREALYGLDAIAADVDGMGRSLEPAMEALMLAEPKHWASHYPGTADEQRLQRHFSYSDRIRYYWPEPRAQAAVDALTTRLEGRTIPETLISQHLARLYPAVVSGTLSPNPRDLCLAAIDAALDPYYSATMSSEVPSRGRPSSATLSPLPD
jgi:D-tagatose-1,6-bisphosphate aldolase subunit GatZ/KbaZ